MKVISKDNYDRDTHSDKVICTCEDRYYAELIAKLLNNNAGPRSNRFFEAVPDDHKLKVWEP